MIKLRVIVGIIIVLFFVMLVHSNQEVIQYKAIRNELGKDFNIKSNKGWIRILNSKKRMKEYNIHLKEEEKKRLINYFKSLIKEESLIIKKI